MSNDLRWTPERLAAHKAKAAEWNGNVEQVHALTARALPRVHAPVAVGAPVPYANLLVMFAERRIYPPITEYRFDPNRQWRFDYAWPFRRVAIEIDGGIWRKGGGAHSHPSNILRDMEKHNAAVLLGWRVIRVTPQQLADAVSMVETLLAGEIAA